MHKTLRQRSVAHSKMTRVSKQVSENPKSKFKKAAILKNCNSLMEDRKNLKTVRGRYRPIILYFSEFSHDGTSGHIVHSFTTLNTIS